MAESEKPTNPEELKALAKQSIREAMDDIDAHPEKRILALESIEAYRAWFSIEILSPIIEPIVPPIVHKPDSIEGGAHEMEHAYPIIDHGNVLATSKAEEMFNAGYSMCKLYYTIEKIIWLLVERLKSGGVSPEDEVTTVIHGHPSTLRYAFASIISVPDNIIIGNYDPGHWGEYYLEMVDNIAKKGYGYPPTSPRDVFKRLHQTTRPPKS